MLARLLVVGCSVGLAACGAGPEFSGVDDWGADHAKEALVGKEELQGDLLLPRNMELVSGESLPPRFRIMAANTTAGRLQSYDTGEGLRIFQGLKPDIALVQEMNIGDNSMEALRTFVDEAFGPEFYVFREEGAQIPNAIISRYPIVAGGQWADPALHNRDFAFARIDIPGERDLFTVSVHLSASNGRDRVTQASRLAEVIAEHVGNDYLVLGGDFNTSGGQPLTLLSRVVTTNVAPPTDNLGDDGTNRSRKQRIDWVLTDESLLQYEVPVRVGAQEFATGLVFDSRTYTPLADVSPVRESDSDAPNMQHMAVMRDFDLTSAHSAALGE